MDDGWRGTRERDGGHNVFHKLLGNTSTSDSSFLIFFPQFLPGTSILLKENDGEGENNQTWGKGKKTNIRVVFSPSST
jgi:hypothetical protein